MKHSGNVILLLTSLIFAYSHAFIDFQQGKSYLFHYRSETSGIKNWLTLNQSIDTEVEVSQRLDDNVLLIQFKNVKITDDIDKPTADELSEVSNAFLVVRSGNHSFEKFLTKEREFVYCLKLKYRVIDKLLSDMSRFTKHIKSAVAKVDVKNLAFGNCNSKVKVVTNKEEVKIGVKAEYKDCHDDGRVNLATVFDLSPNSTTAAIVTYKTKENVVKKINVLSDMMTYNMGGIHLKIRSSMTFKGASEVVDENEIGADFKTIYTKKELDGFIQNNN